MPATQVIARDRHAELLYACASVGATIEAFATEIRHLQRTEVREVEEPFRAGAQKGSSAMPHKRNPVKAEQLSGLARVLRGNLQAGLENVALWHERDISHSSVERIILPDSLQLAYYVLVKFRSIVEGMHVYPERMQENLDASYGLVFSQPVLLALVESGMTRDDAYRVVQRNAMTTWESRRPFLDVLRDDADVVAALGDERLAACFDLTAALANVDRTFDALDALPRRSALSVSKLSLPHHYTGKVRELYEVDHDRMLVVASDRVSVFDVVLPDLIPDKGRVLTALSTFWFEQTAHLAPNHLVSSDPTDFPETAGPDVAGRAMLVRGGAAGAAGVRRPRLPVRLRVVRLPGDRHGHGPRRCPPGMRQAERLPEPIFTPTTKAEEGHDLPLYDADAAALVGADRYERAARPHARGLRVRRRARRRRTG